MSSKTPPSSQDLADEIQRLKDDVAQLKARFANSPRHELEEALAALASARPHPLSAQEKGKLFEEIQQFKNDISSLRSQISQDEQKLTPEPQSPTENREDEDNR